MQNYNRQFIDRAKQAAEDAGHEFATMAACEAALESAYGTSLLARADNNLFGMKQHSHPVYGTHNLPTREFIGIAKEQAMGTPDGVLDGWITTTASWVSYPDWKACFNDRIATLVRLAPQQGFEHYMDAINATDAVTYVKCVSAKWSTDPHRADKVIMIYDLYMAEAPTTAASIPPPIPAPAPPVVSDPFQKVKDSLADILKRLQTENDPNA